MFFTWLLNLLSGSFLSKILDYFTAKLNSDAEVKVAQIQAELATRQAQKEIIAIEEGWWVTAWIRPLIVYPFVVHIGAIVLDSTFKFSWGILALPSPYDSLEQTIVASYFLTRPVEKVARNLVSYLRGK